MNTDPRSPVRFPLGQIVATTGALDALRDSGQRPEEFLSRHARGDWGDVCPEDAALNNEAVAHEGDRDRQQRVLSAYRTTTGSTLWIVTEWDRSVSTLLLPSEY